MLKSYSDKYYLMDLYYRKFYIAFDKNSSSQTLQKLRSMVEGVYINWFMTELSYSCSESISSNLNNSWDILGVVAQKDFYNKYIEPIVYEKRKVFIIIPDALRYEVAAELCDRLDAESLGSVELTSLVSGLPTSTKFGMARLLPHENIELKENGFIYQRDKIEEVDKIAKENINSIESTRRYIVSEEKRDIDGLLRFSMENDFGRDCKLNVYIPKVNIRFKTQGAGANFVHGGIIARGSSTID